MAKRLVLVGLLCVFVAAPAFAATTPNSVVTAQTPKGQVAQITNGTGTAAVAAYTTGTNGSKVVGLMCSNTDPSNAYLIHIQNDYSSTEVTLCTVSVPANSGNTSSAPPVNMLSAANCPGLPLDSDGNPFIYLTASTSTQLSIASTTTVTSSDFVNCIAMGADF